MPAREKIEHIMSWLARLVGGLLVVSINELIGVSSGQGRATTMDPEVMGSGEWTYRAGRQQRIITKTRDKATAEQSRASKATEW